MVRTAPGDQLPSFVVGRIPTAAFSAASHPVTRGWDFWAEYGEALGVKAPQQELRLQSIESDALGMTTLRYDQRYEGLPVSGRRLVLHFRGGDVTVVNGEFASHINVSTSPSLSRGPASRVAVAGVPAREVGEARGSELLIFVDESERPHLAWAVLVPSQRPFGLWRVFVDAHSGEFVSAYNDLHTAKNRNTYTNGNDPDCPTFGPPYCVLPGTLMRTEGGSATGDSVVDAAHNHAGTVYDYYSTEFGRDSYDGLGHSIRSTVHFGVNWNNAAWCPDSCAAVFGSGSDGEQMIYGDGDGTNMSPLAQDIDVVAHELTHAVTDAEAALIYEGQPGALNESYSDVFAAMIDTGDWTVGEDSWTPSIPGDAPRSLANPSAGGQPGHMSQLVQTAFDNGGIHINSGIPSHAAYLTSQGVGYGIGRSATQDLYYRALTTYLTPTSDFLDNLNALLLSAGDLFPGDATKTRAVARAHAAVGIANPPTITIPNGGELFTGGSPTTLAWTSEDAAVSFRISSLQLGAASTYAQGFEAGSVLPSDFQTTGTAGWTTDISTAGSGIRSARSGTIGNGGWSELSLTRRLASTGIMSFKYRVSSEAGYDLLSFYIDGEQVCLSGICERSGAVSWTTWSGLVSAGTHVFTWVYEKDFFCCSSGSDRAWIDDVSIPNVENVTETVINASTPAGASTQSWTVPVANASNFKIRVQALGVASWFAMDDSNATFSITTPFSIKPMPQLSIANAKKIEGDVGKRRMRFIVSLSTSAQGTTTVSYRTKNGKARAPADYYKRSGVLTFAPGVTTKTIVVYVRGDERPEYGRERFYVVLFNPSGASILDISATGVIRDDD